MVFLILAVVMNTIFNGIDSTAEMYKPSKLFSKETFPAWVFATFVLGFLWALDRIGDAIYTLSDKLEMVDIDIAVPGEDDDDTDQELSSK